jgi:hypothetical protein
MVSVLVADSERWNAPTLASLAATRVLRHWGWHTVPARWVTSRAATANRGVGHFQQVHGRKRDSLWHFWVVDISIVHNLS